jgi:hypothetical protein
VVRQEESADAGRQQHSITGKTSDEFTSTDPTLHEAWPIFELMATELDTFGLANFLKLKLGNKMLL